MDKTIQSKIKVIRAETKNTVQVKQSDIDL